MPSAREKGVHEDEGRPNHYEIDETVEKEENEESTVLILVFVTYHLKNSFHRTVHQTYKD